VSVVDFVVDFVVPLVVVLVDDGGFEMDADCEVAVLLD